MATDNPRMTHRGAREHLAFAAATRTAVEAKRADAVTDLEEAEALCKSLRGAISEYDAILHRPPRSTAS